MKKTTMLLGVFLLSIPVFYCQEVPKFSSEAEKAAWIQTHPKEYEQISGTNVEAPQFTTEKEKEAWIKENPGAYLHQGGTPDRIPEFKTQAEKDAWIRSIKDSQVKDSRLVPLFTSEEEKQKWISENPELYKSILESGAIVGPEDRPLPEISRDKAVDTQSYEKKKSEWIMNNPEEYQRIINN